MMTFLIIISGLLLGLLMLAIIKSFHSPGARKIKAVMFFGKLYTFIINVEGKAIYKGEPCEVNGNKIEKWDLIDSKLLPSIPKKEKKLGWFLGSKKLNIYFFPYPFFKIHTYELTYTKAKKLGEEKKGDIIIWQKNEEIVVARKGISDYLEFRAEYAMITGELETDEMATVLLYTNNILEVTNPSDVLFKIDDWFKVTNDILNGAFRGVVAMHNLKGLNQISSGDDKGTPEHPSFNGTIKNLVNEKDDTKPRLGNFGMKLYRTVFKDFQPIGDLAISIMSSHAKTVIAEQEGNAKITTAQKEGDAKIESANREAAAYETTQAVIVKWRKKYLVDTGLAKVDADGNIIELLPDATTKITAEAMKEWSKITGTLVVDSGTLNKIFTINPTKKEEVK